MADLNINNSLNDLHNQVSQPQPTEKAQAIADDLKTTLQPVVDNPEGDHSEHYQSLSERLNLALVDLDVDHPRLSTAIQSVLNELSAVGI